MSTKTISLSLDAYERLCRARQRPAESFSQVVLRAVWQPESLTGRELLRRCQSGRFALPEEGSERIRRLKAGDQPAEDKWRSG